MGTMTKLRRGAATVAGLRAMQDDRILGRLRRRRWRVSLVGFLLAGWVTAAAGLLTEDRQALLLWSGLALSGAALVLLVLATRNLASSLDAYVDERERWQRDRAYRVAYWIILLPCVSGLALLWGRASTGRGVEMLAGIGNDVIAVFASVLIMLFATLPSAVLAILEPDPPTD